jgi:hypothetical protein
MTKINLTILREYRNTFILALCLLMVALIIAILSYNSNKPIAPLTPQSTIVAQNQYELKIDWTKIRIGMSFEELQKVIGKNYQKEDKDGQITITIIPDKRTPLAQHQLVLKNNKLTFIKRSIDSNNEFVSYRQYINQYGAPEVIRQQNAETIGMYGFKNKDQYIVVEANPQMDKVYNIYIMANDHVAKFKEENSKPEEPGDAGFKAEP